MFKYIGDNSVTIKQRNQALIMRLLFRMGPLSRSELTGYTGLTSSAVTKITGELIKDNIILEIGADRHKETGPGRTPILLDFVPNRHGVIGMNISQNYIEAGLVDLRGRILAKKRIGVSTNSLREPLEIARTAAALARQMKKEAENNSFIIHQTGICCPGVIDTAAKYIMFSSTLQWKNVPFGKIMEEMLPDLPLTLGNNVKAMTLAEQWFGEKAGAYNLVMIYIGYGIGCGQVVNGEIYTGSHYRAGEFGHIIVDEPGEDCFCGKRGCLETVASSRAIISKINKKLQLPSEQTLAEKAVIELIISGNDSAIGVLEEAGCFLGKAAAYIINLLDPDVIVLAGRIITPESPLMKSCKMVIQEKAFLNGTQLDIIVSKLDDDLGILGGAVIALDRSFYGL